MHSFRSFFGETARLCYSCLARRSKDQGLRKEGDQGTMARTNGKDKLLLILLLWLPLQWQAQNFNDIKYIERHTCVYPGHNAVGIKWKRMRQRIHSHIDIGRHACVDFMYLAHDLSCRGNGEGAREDFAAA